jgi:DNA-binding response OmpR family regulator
MLRGKRAGLRRRGGHRGIVSHELRREGHTVPCEAEVTDVRRLLAGWQPDVVLLDLELDPALALLSELARVHSVLALTGFQGIRRLLRSLSSRARAVRRRWR